MAAMRRGDFAAAWKISDRVLAERCARREDCSHWPRHLQFVWDGSTFDDEHVLVRCYHGLGDTIQYARFFEPLRRRARELTVWAQPALLGLLSRVRGIDRVLPLHDDVPEIAYDVDIELMEVAHALRITTADLPGPIPYISLSPEGAWSSSALRVGLAWRSGDWDETRSIPAALLDRLATVPGVTFYSLQYPAERLPFDACKLACRDIERMARRMLSLDLVIAVDTMVAHLAGALGLPTWLLLPDRHDWRWLDDADQSPWYPTMRLFRRTGFDWRPLLVNVCNELSAERRRAIAARYIR